MPYKTNMDEFMFFQGKTVAFELYQEFAEKLFRNFPDTGMIVQKTQITFKNPRIFACVSFAKVRKVKDCPKEYIVITLGLHRQIQSSGVDAVTEPYPGSRIAS